MQSVSDDDARKRLLEKPRFELAAKGVFRLGRCYIFWQEFWGKNKFLGHLLMLLCMSQNDNIIATKIMSLDFL